jgi:hypothetical protein
MEISLEAIGKKKPFPEIAFAISGLALMVDGSG